MGKYELNMGDILVMSVKYGCMGYVGKIWVYKGWDLGKISVTND